FYSISLSFFTGEGMRTPTQFVGLDNYIKLFTQYPFNERFFNALGNTVIFFLIVTLFQNVLGFFIAVLISRKFRGNNFFKKLSFLPTTLSVLVIGFMFRMMLNPTWGIFDRILEGLGLESLIRPWLGNTTTALPVLAIVVSWQFLGEAILFYTVGIANIDNEILEAARIDGANSMAEIRHIIFPSILPIIGIVTILIFIGDFTQFDIVYAMTTTRGNPVYSTDLLGSLFYRSTFQSPEKGGWGIGMGATLASVISIIVFVGVLTWLIAFKMKGSERK
ncbi:MAG: sugar ABC transporter permease, partial [Thermodesulfovibrionales bacterium]